jgi:hypothetical protein
MRVFIVGVVLLGGMAPSKASSDRIQADEHKESQAVDLSSRGMPEHASVTEEQVGRSSSPSGYLAASTSSSSEENSPRSKDDAPNGTSMESTGSSKSTPRSQEASPRTLDDTLSRSSSSSEDIFRDVQASVNLKRTTSTPMVEVSVLSKSYLTPDTTVGNKTPRRASYVIQSRRNTRQPKSPRQSLPSSTDVAKNNGPSDVYVRSFSQDNVPASTGRVRPKKRSPSHDSALVSSTPVIAVQAEETDYQEPDRTRHSLDQMPKSPSAKSLPSLASNTFANVAKLESITFTRRKDGSQIKVDVHMDRPTSPRRTSPFATARQTPLSSTPSTPRQFSPPGSARTSPRPGEETPAVVVVRQSPPLLSPRSQLIDKLSKTVLHDRLQAHQTRTHLHELASHRDGPPEQQSEPESGEGLQEEDEEDNDDDDDDAVRGQDKGND